MAEFGVIFDMDGVIIDSYHAHLESWQLTAAQYGVSMTEAEFVPTFGRTSREVIQSLWPGRFGDAEVAAFDRDKEQAYREILERHFPAMDGIAELIAGLHEAGFALAIGSSGPRENVELTHRVMPHGDLLSAVVHGGMVHKGKPDPEIFLLAAARLGLPAGKCAVVEDAVVGLEAARRAGMAAVAITGTFTRAELASHADLVIDSHRELTVAKVMEVIRGHPNA